MLGRQNIGLATPTASGLMSGADKAKLNSLTGGFVFTQDSPSAFWTITHNLGGYPAVTVVDSAGSVVEGSVDYVDVNTLTISFNPTFSGVAYLT